MRPTSRVRLWDSAKASGRNSGATRPTSARPTARIGRTSNWLDHMDFHELAQMATACAQGSGHGVDRRSLLLKVIAALSLATVDGDLSGIWHCVANGSDSTANSTSTVTSGRCTRYVRTVVKQRNSVLRQTVVVQLDQR